MAILRGHTVAVTTVRPASVAWGFVDLDGPGWADDAAETAWILGPCGGAAWEDPEGDGPEGWSGEGGRLRLLA